MPLRGAAWEQAVMTHVPDLPYLREVPIVSVVFTDVVGYTSLSSTLEPKLVLKMLHEYFSKLVRPCSLTPRPVAPEGVTCVCRACSI